MKIDINHIRNKIKDLEFFLTSFKQSEISLNNIEEMQEYINLLLHTQGEISALQYLIKDARKLNQREFWSHLKKGTL